MRVLFQFICKYSLPVLTVCLGVGQACNVFAQARCRDIFQTQPVQVSSADSDLKGSAFLHQRDPNLYKARYVELQGHGSQPAEKIQAWMEYLRLSYTKYRSQPQVMKRIKDYYHRKYLTNINEVQQSFFDAQVRIAREQGRGQIHLDEQSRERLLKIGLEDQKKSFDEWLDYFLSRDSDMYPMWAKYWCFQGMVKLGIFDREKGTFGARSRGAVMPFADLNREALSIVMSAIVKKVNGKSLHDINDPKLLELLKGANFGKLYGRSLLINSGKVLNTSSTAGAWVVFKRGSDPRLLVDSLKGMNTGWCTAGEETAREQLMGGDFHVYYGLDDHGSPTVPRIAIRMDGDKIAEIRGVAAHQNLDEVISDSSVLPEKLNEFGDEGKAYLKKTSDMKRLTEFDKSVKAGNEPSVDDLRFLYEIDKEILGFGWGKDPRIFEIRNNRNIKADLARIMNIKESEVSVTEDEALRGGIKYHYGNLTIRGSGTLKDFKFPETVSGNVHVVSDGSMKNVEFPKVVGGDLEIFGVVPNAVDVTFGNVQGTVRFSDMRSMVRVRFSKVIQGDLLLLGLEAAQDVVFPEFVGGDLQAIQLRTAVNVTYPKEIRNDLSLGLSSGQGQILSKTVGGKLYLYLVSADGMIFPESVQGDLTLPYLRSAQGTIFPKHVGGSVRVESLDSSEDVRFPEDVGGDLLIPNLKSLKGLSLPKRVAGKIEPAGLKSEADMNLWERLKFNLKVKLVPKR